MSSTRRSTILIKQCRTNLAHTLRPSPSCYSSLPQQTDLLQRYQSLVATGRITRDDEQIQVVMALRRLQKDLSGYAPQQHASTLLWTPRSKADSTQTSDPWWKARKDGVADEAQHASSVVKLKDAMEELASLDTPKGLVLTGSPGSGKSFLIDLWFSGMPTPYKVRKHYSELVIELYRAVWEETQLRMAYARAYKDSHQAPEDVAWSKNLKKHLQALLSQGSLPIKWNSRHLLALSASQAEYTPTIAFAVAQRLVQRHWLLVFDEIQLLDVSSATLLADVLSWFWRMGGVIVGTSNKVPDDLYKNGVQRERLQPFVEALKIRSPVHTMKSATDWRELTSQASSSSSWYTGEQRAAFQDHLDSLVEEQPVLNRSLRIFGRNLRVPWSTQNVCAFTFGELCEESLGSAGYISLASRYDTLVLTDIPILPVAAKNQARRFISLIDALYEARCRLVCRAEARPEDLFFPDAEEMVKVGAHHEHHQDVIMAESVSEMHGRYRPNISSYDSPGMEHARAPVVLAMDKLSIFSGQEEQFAFKRALSRLLEMTSPLYSQNEVWAPLSEAARQWEGVKAQHTPTVNAPGGSSSENSETVGLKTQPEAPKLRPEHVWGVREDWGPRTGKWGQGAKAYESQGERSS